MDTLSLFKDHLSIVRRLSFHTISAYLSDLEKFNSFRMKDALSSSFGSHLEIRMWIAHLSESGVETRSIRRKIASLKSYFKFLKSRNLIQSNPTQKIIQPKVKKALPVVHQESKLRQVLFQDKACDFNEFETIRDHLIVHFLYSTGIRRAELINLMCKDVDLNRQIVKVIGKGNKERILPLHRELISLIECYLKIRNTENIQVTEHFFVNSAGKKIYPKLVHRIVEKKLGTHIQTEKRSPHTLRHSFATHMADSGADLYAIKELLGHSSLNATQIYTHSSISKILEMYKLCHPRTQ